MRILNAAVTHLGRTASLAMLLATSYGAALIVGGFVAPLYETTSVSPSGVVKDGTDTLVGVNGLGVVIVLGVPLVMTLAVGWALWHGSRRGAISVAWALTGLLGVLNVAAMLSIGVFVLPVTAALIVACAARRPRARPARAAEHRPGNTSSELDSAKNTPATAGLALGIISPFVGPVAGIVGLVLSGIGLSRSNTYSRAGHSPAGHKKAIWGLILSSLGTTLSIGLLILLLGH